MRLLRLQLEDFRSYERAALEFPRGITVVAGRNAQGKTNLLESVFLLCAGRSHRTPREEELIRNGAAQAVIRSDFTRGNVAHDVTMVLRRGAKKRIRLDGANVARTADLVGQMQSVLFSPENIMIVKDSPARRRGYMDVALSQVYKSYLASLLAYNRALAARNAILKQGPDGAAWATLDVFDVQLADTGARVMAARRMFCEESAPRAAALQKKISGGQDELELAYAPCVDCDRGQECEALFSRLQKERERDIFRRVTGSGPHRDDMTLRVNGMEARLFASQGQQRTTALAIKMAELAFMREHTGTRPILLLDDVFGELDASRRAQLLTAVGDCQTILTCTNVEALPIDRSRVDAIYSVENAQITGN